MGRLIVRGCRISSKFYGGTMHRTLAGQRLPCSYGMAVILAPPRPEVLHMRIRAVRVKNLRAVRDCTLVLGRLTALVGPNGAGKSTFLHALELFQDAATACQKDYYNLDTSRDIEIRIAFTSLQGSEVEAFSQYARNGELCVACTIRWERGKARPRSLIHGGGGAAPGPRAGDG